MLFHDRSSAPKSCVVTIAGQDFCFQKFGVETVIAWSDLNKFEINKHFPYKIVLTSDKSETIAFDYFVVDKNQRERIVQHIQTRLTQ